MTRKEASRIAIGDKLIYKEHYAFTVKDISYVEPCNIPRSRVVFRDKNGEGFLHIHCRLYDKNKE